MRKSLFWVALAAALAILAVAAYVASRRTSTSDNTTYGVYWHGTYLRTLADARKRPYVLSLQTSYTV
jgi:hypothetical protein